MKKLIMNVEELRVETFHTAEGYKRDEGTVRGFEQIGPQRPTSDWTFDVSCKCDTSHSCYNL